MSRPWPETREELRRLVEEERQRKSDRAIAKEIGIAHPTLRRHLEGKTEEPYGRTREAIEAWVDRKTGTLRPELEQFAQRGVREPRAPYGAESPEHELLEYFLEHADQMATFMRTSTEGLGPEDRRKVALALLNGFKRLLIEQGMPIPQQIYDLERKFVADD